MLPEGNHRIKMTSGPDNFEKLSHLQKNGFYNQTMRNMLQLNRGGIIFLRLVNFRVFQIPIGVGLPCLQTWIMMVIKIFLLLMVIKKTTPIWIF